MIQADPPIPLSLSPKTTVMKSSSLIFHYSRREKWFSMWRSVSPVFLCFLGLATVLSYFLICSPNSCKVSTANQELLDHQKNEASVQPRQNQNENYQNCDLFNGHWIPDMNGSLYTNSSCRTIPDSKNCFRHGREDDGFLKWRWKPEGCEVRRFDPRIFLGLVRGKTLAFIGDSVARNQMESLLCLLSQDETPKDLYKDSEDRFQTWYFPSHNFTLMILWSKFLIAANERVINGSSSGIFDLHLDKIDEKWAETLPSTDVAVVSDAHWFFRKLYLYKANNLTGCVYCNEPNVTDLGLAFALRMAFRGALGYVNNCGKCKSGMLTLLRTFSPAHFENGTWDNGGSCRRTSPLTEGEINLRSFEWELRSVQMDEVERARGKGKKRGKRFGAMDITRAMLMRPDGHPGEFWGNKWMNGYSDCVHWCMPGPVDVWNDFLMAVLQREIGSSSAEP